MLVSASVVTFVRKSNQLNRSQPIVQLCGIFCLEVLQDSKYHFRIFGTSDAKERNKPEKIFKHPQL